MTLRLVTPPVDEPLTVGEVEAHLRLMPESDPVYVMELVRVARHLAEQHLGRALLAQTWDLVLDRWPRWGAVEIPLGGVASVTSVKVHDGTQFVTVSPSVYQVTSAGVLAGGRTRVVPLPGQSWPVPADRLECIEMRFTAGWATPAEVPMPIKQWMLLMVGHYYEQRERAAERQVHQVPFVDGLLDPYRVAAVA